jgi:hypothetical protein
MHRLTINKPKWCLWGRCRFRFVHSSAHRQASSGLPSSPRKTRGFSPPKTKQNSTYTQLITGENVDVKQTRIVAVSPGWMTTMFGAAQKQRTHGEHRRRAVHCALWNSELAARGLLHILTNNRRAPRRTARRGLAVCRGGHREKMEQGGERVSCCWAAMVGNSRELAMSGGQERMELGS